VGITTGSREVPGRNACDRRHTYRIIIIIIIVIIINQVAQLSSTPSREPEYHTKYKHNLKTPTCNLGASAIQSKDLILIKMNTLTSTVHTEVWEG